MTGPLSNYECPTLRGPVPMVLEKSAPTVICKRPRTGQFTDERSANFKRIISMLRTGPLTRSMVADFLGIDVKLASKYLCDLGRAGVTRFKSQKVAGIGKIVRHRLSANVEAVDSFLARLDAPRKSSPTRVRVSDDPARHFHLIFTGAMIHPEPVATPEPDPLALPPLFFRPVRLDDEPLPRAPAAQVARSSFPAPNSAAFVVPT